MRIHPPSSHFLATRSARHPRVGVDPWATFPTGLATPKPHRRLDPAAAALAEAVKRDGKLRLRHFLRVRGGRCCCLHKRPSAAATASRQGRAAQLLQLTASLPHQHPRLAPVHRVPLLSEVEQSGSGDVCRAHPASLPHQASLSTVAALACAGQAAWQRRRGHGRPGAACGQRAAVCAQEPGEAGDAGAQQGGCHAPALLSCWQLSGGGWVGGGGGGSQRGPPTPSVRRAPGSPPSPSHAVPPQVGRVRTEEAILSSVDHPFLATLYGTLQTGVCVCVRTGRWLLGAEHWAVVWRLCPWAVLKLLLSTLQAPIAALRAHARAVAAALFSPQPQPPPPRSLQTPTSTSCSSTATAASCMRCSMRSQSEPGGGGGGRARGGAGAAGGGMGACRVLRHAHAAPSLRCSSAPAPCCHLVPGQHPCTSPTPAVSPPLPPACACSKRLKENSVQFYASEVLLALQYLHLQGFVYRCVGALTYIVSL